MPLIINNKPPIRLRETANGYEIIRFTVEELKEREKWHAEIRAHHASIVVSYDALDEDLKQSFLHWMPKVRVSVPGTPPKLAESVISFSLPASSLETTLGDMEEGFNQRLDRFGARHARRWYVWRACGSALAYAWPVVRRAVGLEHVLKMTGLI